MLFRRIRNISFRKKMTLIFAVVCTFATCIVGILYYKFAENEIVKNFTVNAESLVSQLGNTLDTRLEAVNRRAFAALTNQAFIRPLTNYMRSPDLEKEVVLASEAAYYLKDISRAEPFVNSTMIYTSMGAWDDYTKIRKWDFDFEQSVFGEVYEDPNTKGIQWLPAMTDEIFKGGSQVIPYVRRFTVGAGIDEPAYLIIQLDQKEMIKELTGDAKKLGEILITDEKGNYIAGTPGISTPDLQKKLSGENRSQEDIWYSDDIKVNGDAYLMYKGVLGINNWQIYILKSKADLLESVGRLRNLIVGLTVGMIGICLVLVAFLSKQLTSSLQRLAVQMNRMRNGELEARYYYPYTDEVGSLAKSFNFMADQVEKSMKKQEEYIQVLKEERDFVEQVQKQKRKAELRALQAQINPHFLYNTLNTITWMASDQGMDEVRILSNSLGKFFRISLSRGAEVISVQDEIEHVKSYLAIQEIRYAEVMQYEVNVSQELRSCTILKLVLQPLVENSIYHGIKEKGCLCQIRISAEKRSDPTGQEWLRFVVEDTGMGINPEKLEMINEGMEEGTTEYRDGYGIFNVNERIKLYYGEQYGMTYESREGEWTRAILTVPVRFATEEET